MKGLHASPRDKTVRGYACNSNWACSTCACCGSDLCVRVCARACVCARQVQTWCLSLLNRSLGCSSSGTKGAQVGAWTCVWHAAAGGGALNHSHDGGVADFLVVATSSLPVDSPSRNPSWCLDAIEVPASHRMPSSTIEYRIVVVACSHVFHCVTLSRVGVDVWRWTTHAIPSVLHEFMGWAPRKPGSLATMRLPESDSDVEDGQAPKGSGRDITSTTGGGGGASVNSAATPGYFADRKMEEATSGELQQHWVPFEGLSTAAKRPNEVLDVCILPPSSSHDYKNRMSLAVLYVLWFAVCRTPFCVLCPLHLSTTMDHGAATHPDVFHAPQVPGDFQRPLHVERSPRARRYSGRLPAGRPCRHMSPLLWLSFLYTHEARPLVRGKTVCCGVRGG